MSKNTLVEAILYNFSYKVPWTRAGSALDVCEDSFYRSVEPDAVAAFETVPFRKSRNRTFSSPTTPRLNIRQNRNWQFAIFNEPGSVLSAIGIPKFRPRPYITRQTFHMSVVKSFGIRRDKRFSEIKRRQMFSRIQFGQARLSELKPYHSFRYTNAFNFI